MWSFQNKVGYDKRSGRPEAPLFWQLRTFFVVVGWIMALLMAGFTLLALRDSETGLAVTCALTGVFLVVFVHWRKRQIDCERLRFQQLVDEYEKAISQPPF
ncbi:hypothetical protein BH11PSE5_BH11PSE5_12050 [soil metagenome]